MKTLTKRRIVLLAFVVLLTALSTVVFTYQHKIWSVTGQSALHFAKLKWAEGQKQEAMELWLYGIGRTVRDSINRERAYSIVRRSDRFLAEGNLSEALDACHEAEQIYNEEGEITYHCMMVEARIFGNAAPTS